MVKPVFLIGLPGAGKTTLGRQLADAMQYPLFDLDALIEAGEGQPVALIFQQQGEAHFRQLEKQYLEQCIAAHPVFVMATGGGTPCFHQNIETMNRAGITIFLDVPAGEVTRRLEAAGTAGRPLLAATGTLKKQIESLRLQRLPFYQQAAFTLSGDTIGLTDVIKTASPMLPKTG